MKRLTAALLPAALTLVIGGGVATALPEQAVDTPIPYSTRVVEFNTLPVGAEVVKVKGVDGVKRTEMVDEKVLGSDGKWTTISRPETTVVSLPVEEVVWRGTAPLVNGVDEKIVEEEKAKAEAEAEARAQAEAQAAASRSVVRETLPSTPTVYSGDDPRSIASGMLPSFGWGAEQMSCLDSLWTRESGWNPYAQNPSSGAYGIPQSLPGSKMASAGADWQTNPTTQITWGLGYIQGRYGSPCSAWAHSESVGWY